MYVRVTKTVADKGVLVHPDEVEKQIDDRKVDWYVSAFTYGDDSVEYFKSNNGSIKGYNGDAWTSALYWDLDCKGDFEKVADEALKLIDKLEEIGVLGSTTVYFSGNKGVHIYVDTDGKFTPEETSRICYNLAKDAKVDNSVLDTSVYNMTRIFRIVNTRHQESKLYKIPLDIEELEKLSEKEIRSLAKKQRKEEFEPELCDAKIFKDLYPVNVKQNSNVLHLFDHNDPDKPDFKDCPKNHPRCIYSLEKGYIEQGHRHDAILRLAAYYKHKGLDRDDAATKIFEALNKRHEVYPEITDADPSENERDIDEIYSDKWEGGYFTCKNDRYLASKCDVGNGPCWKHLDEEEEVFISRAMDIDSLILDYIKYGMEADKDYPKTGINWLDDMIRLRPRNYSIVNGANGCVDADTEFLSPSGWKRIADYNSNDEVMQYDPNTGLASFVYPEEYIKKPCDLMWHFYHPYGLDQMLSDEHRVLYETTRGNLAIKTANEIADRAHNNNYGFAGKILTSFKIDHDTHCYDNLDLGKDQARLMVAVIADGHFPNNTNRCVIRLKKKRKKERLKLLLKKAAIPYKERVCGGDPDYTVTTFYAPKRHKHFSSVYYSCRPYEMDGIYEEIFFWDGNEKTKTFSTTNLESAKFVQYLLSTKGFRSTISAQDRIGQKKVNEYEYKSIEYTVTCTNQTKVSMRSPNFNPMRVRTKDGYKYCFTVPTGFLVLRRNKNIFITGNSGKTSLAIQMLEEWNKQELHNIFFSLDMASPSLFEKLGARYTEFNIREIEEAFNRNTENKHIQKEVIEAIKEKLPYTFFDFTSSASVEHIEKTIIAVESERGVNLRAGIVDYAGRLTADSDSAYMRATYNATTMNDVVKRQNLHLVVISQVSRENGDHTDPLRTSRVAKESGAWEENATIIVNVWRTFGNGIDAQDKFMNIYVAKNRSGSLGEMIFGWEGTTGSISDLSRKELAEYRSLCEQHNINSRMVPIKSPKEEDPIDKEAKERKKELEEGDYTPKRLKNRKRFERNEEDEKEISDRKNSRRSRRRS